MPAKTIPTLRDKAAWVFQVLKQVAEQEDKMTSKQEYQLPWKIDKGSFQRTNGRISIIEDKASITHSSPVADVPIYGDDGTATATAAFIVLACNNFERLLEALKDIQRDVDASSPSYARAWKIAEAAIAAVEKGDAIIERMAHQTTLSIQCAWCGLDMGKKPGKGQSGISHSICDQCIKKMGLAPPK